MQIRLRAPWRMEYVLKLEVVATLRLEALDLRRGCGERLWIMLFRLKWC